MANILVIGAGLLFQFKLSTPTPVPVTPVGYTATVITKELGANGVFTKVAQLTVVPETPASEAAYDAGDLGKGDIAKLE